MELNREQIVKALECCGNKVCRNCNDCPYCGISPWSAQCATVLSNDALAIIRELTEENEKLGIENFDLICELSRIKENTVRKMQERLKARYRLPQSNEVYTISPFQLHECIDQIAKGMLEDQE